MQKENHKCNERISFRVRGEVFVLRRTLPGQVLSKPWTIQDKSWTCQNQSWTSQDLPGPCTSAPNLARAPSKVAKPCHHLAQGCQALPGPRNGLPTHATKNSTLSKPCPDPLDICIGARKSEFIEKITNVTIRFHFE